MVKKIFAPIFGEVELRVHVVVIEDVFHPQQFEGQRNQENVVRGVAALNDLKAAPQINPPGKPELPEKRTEKFHQIFQWGAAFGGQRMAVDVHSLQKLVSLFISLAPGTKHSDLIAVGSQGAGFLPHASVERNRKVLHDDL